jgi:hypothetical protein
MVAAEEGLTQFARTALLAGLQGDALQGLQWSGSTIPGLIRCAARHLADSTHYVQGRAFALVYKTEWGPARSVLKSFCDRHGSCDYHAERNPFQLRLLRTRLFTMIDMYKRSLSAGRSFVAPVRAATEAHRTLLHFQAFAQGCDLFMGLPPAWHQQAGQSHSHT